MTAVASGLGTILLGHGRNPLTLDYWVLNMEANNKDPDKQSEAAIRGSVVENRLTIVHAASGAKTFVPLDGNPIDPSRSLGMPTSLDFIPLGEFQQGFAWVVGALSDRALLLDPQGNLSRRVDLPEGSIPRAVLFDALNDRVLFYCFGTNEVRVHAQLNPAQVLASLSLGHDPAPASVREGRKIFYDASHSASDNASCASCHIDGRTDMVAWNLSNLPKDDKGPLVTQSLAGIEHLLPLHWRGEQKNGLIDFNAAFPNLLGGKPLDTTPGGEFDQFQDFVFSINSPANPNQSPERLLDQAYSPSHHTGAPGNPVEGQTIWFDLPRVAMLTCNQCHQMPTGTNNDTSTDGRGQAIEQARMKVAGFNELWRKAQPEVLVEFNPAEPPPNEQQLYPLLEPASRTRGR